MALQEKDLDAIGEAAKQVIQEELEPIKQRLEALENGTAGKSGELEEQVNEMKAALDQTVGASKALDDDDGQVVRKSQPHRDAWGRRVHK